MSSSSLDCEEAFEEGEEIIFILPVPPDLSPPPTTESSSLDLIETLLVIFLLKLNKHENKEASDDDSEKLITGDEFIFQSPCEDATSVDDEDLPPPPETTEPPIESDQLNGNLSVDNSSLMVSTTSSENQNQQNVHVSINRRIEMPPAFHVPSDLISEVEYPMLPRDVTDNAALFPMVNQIDKEFKDLAFEEKEQLFFQSPEEPDELKRDVTNLEEEVHRKLSDM